MSRKKIKPKRISRKIQTDKTDYELIESLREKKGTYKNVAKTLGISEYSLRSHRQYLLGDKRGKRRIDDGKILKAAKKEKLETKKPLTVYANEKVGLEKLKIPSKFPKGKEYVMTIFTLKVKKSNSKLPVTYTVSQVYHKRDGVGNIRKWVREYINVHASFRYVYSVTILQFGLVYF